MTTDWGYCYELHATIYRLVKQHPGGTIYHYAKLLGKKRNRLASVIAGMDRTGHLLCEIDGRLYPYRNRSGDDA